MTALGRSQAENHLTKPTGFRILNLDGVRSLAPSDLRIKTVVRATVFSFIRSFTRADKKSLKTGGFRHGKRNQTNRRRMGVLQRIRRDAPEKIRQVDANNVVRDEL